MGFSIYATDVFDEEFEKISKFEQIVMNNIFLQLKVNPFVGDAIRYNFFREKRIKGKRIYYLIYPELKSVLLIAVSSKKSQQKTIDNVIKKLPEFKDYIIRLLS